MSYETFNEWRERISSLIKDLLEKEFKKSKNYLNFISRRKEILENIKDGMGSDYQDSIEGMVSLEMQNKFKESLNENVSHQDIVFDLVYYEKQNLDKVKEKISDDEKTLNQYLYIVSEIYDKRIESIFSQAIESSNKIFKREDEIDFDYAKFEEEALRDIFLPEDNTLEVFLFFLDESINDLSLKNSNFKSIVNLFKLEFDIFRWLYLEKEKFYKNEEKDILVMRFEILKSFFNAKIKQLLKGMMVVNISDLDAFKRKIKKWFSENENIILQQQEDDFIHYIDNFEIKPNFAKGGGDINLRWDMDLIKKSNHYKKWLKRNDYSKKDGQIYKNGKLVSREEFKKDVDLFVEDLIKIKKESLIKFYTLLSKK